MPPAKGGPKRFGSMRAKRAARQATHSCWRWRNAKCGEDGVIMVRSERQLQPRKEHVLVLRRHRCGWNKSGGIEWIERAAAVELCVREARHEAHIFVQPPVEA